MSSARSRSIEKSGSTRSMPSISAVGNIRPVSTITIRPSYSTTVMFLPISPSPPRGRIRTEEPKLGGARRQQALRLERRAHRRRASVSSASTIGSRIRAEGISPSISSAGLDGDRVRVERHRLVDGPDRCVDLAGAVEVAGLSPRRRSRASRCRPGARRRGCRRRRRSRAQRRKTSSLPASTSSPSTGPISSLFACLTATTFSISRQLGEQVGRHVDRPRARGCCRAITGMPAASATAS